jgi:hypothetical protein
LDKRQLQGIYAEVLRGGKAVGDVKQGIDSQPRNPSAEKEYLSLEELTQLIPYRPQTIRNLMSQRVLTDIEQPYPGEM